jgi:hypothetical protein
MAVVNASIQTGETIMFRKTIIALIAVAALGPTSAAFAQERDGDGNPVPGTFVNRPTTDWERAYAGPRQANGINAAQKAMADRLSAVH